MKKIFLLTAAISILSYPCFAYPPMEMENGDRVKQYDEYGHYEGYYKKQGNRVKKYNKYGSYQGYYKQQGDKVKEYSKYGHYEGYYKK